MKRFFLVVSCMVLALAAWTAFVVVATLKGWWREPLAPRGDAQGFLRQATAQIQTHRGNAAFVLIERGQVLGGHFASIGKPVDWDTLFQVASLSKWITAWGVMTLVEDGKLDLDAPVSKYLTRWKLPDSSFDNDGVTTRRLLSHTAGLTDGLGYGGFKPGERLQSLEESLTRARDASPGADGRVRVGHPPGSEWKYSGGGYTLLQLLVEEISGEAFHAYMARRVFEPLGMSRSTFVLGDNTTNVADFYDVGGKPSVHYRFTATAAASLYTSAGDLTRFIQAHLQGARGEPVGRGSLAAKAVADMRRPQAHQFGAAIWGMGPILYAENNSGGFIIGHDGNNGPAVNTAARMDPATGNAIVVLETGSALLATKLAGDWIYWQTGNADLLAIVIESGQTVRVLAIGAGVIVLAAIVLGWRLRRRRA